MHNHTICLDAGHGGKDPGALGPNGTRESERALDVCLRLRDMLAPHFNVVMTRDTDVFVELSERPKIGNRAGANLFISYHFNAASSPNTKLSWEVFTTPGQNNSDKFATFAGNRHAVLFPNQSMRADTSDGDLDKEANFTVIKGTNCPAILFEGEFIHTAHGEKSINNPDHQQARAYALFQACLAYFDMDGGSYPSTPQKPILSDSERIDELEKRVTKLENK
jgi:N-acetylmuramoyl-L-alanine amidase